MASGREVSVRLIMVSRAVRRKPEGMRSVCLPTAGLLSAAEVCASAEASIHATALRSGSFCHTIILASIFCPDAGLVYSIYILPTDIFLYTGGRSATGGFFLSMNRSMGRELAAGGWSVGAGHGSLEQSVCSVCHRIGARLLVLRTCPDRRPLRHCVPGKEQRDPDLPVTRMLRRYTT